MLEHIAEVTTAGALPEEVVQAFAASLRGQLLRPGDEGYERSRQVWNGLIDRQPALIARCQGVADVMAAGNFGRTHNLLISVRGGGHNVAGTAVCDGGLMIDLSSMRAVRVDPKARRAQVQGGATWGDVDRETQAFGLAVSGGVVSSTGVAGLTLAGGYGWLRSKYGLTCDMLRSVDVVTAVGELLTANAQQNADLYWAVRGGGGNFGIVTNFEFDLADIGTEVAFCAVMYPVEHAREIMQAWRQCVATAPDEFTTDCHLWAVPALEGFPPELWGRSVAIVAGVYCGDLDEGEHFIAPLRRLADPLLDLSGRWPFLHVQQAFDPVFPHNEHLHYWKSLYLNRFDAKVWDVVLEHFARKPSPLTLVATRALNGAVQRVAADATAFGDRSAPFLISIDSTWEDAEATGANITWTRELWSALQPFSGGRTYFSFAGMMEEGDALVRKTFGANYARLAEIKRKYDPDNFFRLNQNIKPAGE